MKKKKPVFEGKLRIKKGDEVIVLAGKDKGKRGKVIEAIPEEGKLIVDGVNVVTRHRKPRGTTSKAVIKQQMGEMQIPLAVPSAKVMLVCPKCNKETRISTKVAGNGDKGRACLKCGEMIDG